MLFHKNRGVYVIVVFGRISSGKSYICKFLNHLGFPYVSSDAISSIVLKNSTKELVECFGEEILCDANTHNSNIYGFNNSNLDNLHLSTPFCKTSIDKKKLSNIVFSDILKLHALEEIMHPQIYKLRSQVISELVKKVSFFPTNCIIVEAPLLFCGDNDIVYDASVMVTVEEDLRRERMLLRYGENAHKFNEIITQRQKALVIGDVQYDHLIDTSFGKKKTKIATKKIFHNVKWLRNKEY